MARRADATADEEGRLFCRLRNLIHASRWVAGLAFAVLAFAATSLSSGTWCLGSDGHIAIELTNAGRCTGLACDAGATTATVSLRGSAQPGDHCGPCTDLIGPAAEWRAGRKPSASDADCTIAVTGATSWVAIAPPAWIARSATRDRLVPTRAALRAVLRC